MMMTGGREADRQRTTGELPDHQMPACGFFTGADQELVMPPGFRFHPFDDELIVHYLFKKAAGKTLPFGLEAIIPTVPLFYGPDGEGDPRCLFQRLPQATRHHPLVQRTDEFYIFTQWAHCNAGGRPTRIAGPGTWNFNHDRAVVDGRGRAIGRVAHLTFLLRDKDGTSGKKRGKGPTTHWVMHEYQLLEELEGEADGGGRRRGAKRGRRTGTEQQQQQPCEGRLVLCRIRYTQKDKDNSGDVQDVDEGHFNDGSLLLPPRKRRAVRGLAQEEAAVEETRAVKEVPQHPAAAFCSTLLDPPPPPPDHRHGRVDVPNGPVAMCPTVLDVEDVMPPAPAAPPATPLYDREGPLQQFVCPPAPAAVVPTGQLPADPADAQRDHRGTTTLRAFLPHYAGVGEVPVPSQLMTPPAPVADVREPRGFDPATIIGEGCGPCAGDDDLGVYMEQDMDGNWMIHLGDFLPEYHVDSGNAARTETYDTGHDDSLRPTAPAAAPAPVCARDPPRLHVAAFQQHGSDEDVHELPQVIDVVDPLGDVSLEYFWQPEPPDRPPDEPMIPLRGAGGFPAGKLR